MSGIIGTSKSKSGVIGKSQDTAKAWCDFNGGGTPASNSSFNISSITTPTTGHFIVNFINIIGVWSKTYTAIKSQYNMTS